MLVSLQTSTPTSPEPRPAGHILLAWLTLHLTSTSDYSDHSEPPPPGLRKWQEHLAGCSGPQTWELSGSLSFPSILGAATCQPGSSWTGVWPALSRLLCPRSQPLSPPGSLSLCPSLSVSPALMSILPHSQRDFLTLNQITPFTF